MAHRNQEGPEPDPRRSKWPMGCANHCRPCREGASLGQPLFRSIQELLGPRIVDVSLAHGAPPYPTSGGVRRLLAPVQGNPDASDPSAVDTAT